MSDEERYEKLKELLNQSKQYSDWLKTKMEQSENERAKELQARKEADKVIFAYAYYQSDWKSELFPSHLVAHNSVFKIFKVSEFQG